MMIDRNSHSGWRRTRSTARMRPRPGRIPEPCRDSSQKSPEFKVLSPECGPDSELRTQDSGLVREDSEKPGKCRFHLRTRRDQVHHPVLDQKLRALKSFRKRLPDRLLDDARPG